jgi:hypothetical protein
MMVPGVGFEPSVNGEITRAIPFFFKTREKVAGK